MLKRGDSPEDIAEVLEVPTETVKAWEKKFYAVVQQSKNTGIKFVWHGNCFTSWGDFHFPFFGDIC